MSAQYMLEDEVMWFDAKNREKVDELYIHDSEFAGFSYDYDKRVVYLNCDNYYLKKRFKFVFHNVIWCGMQSCLFWGGGNSILDIHLEEPCAKMEELYTMSEKMRPPFHVNRSISYLPVGFLINSGDTLLIICEAMKMTENDLVTGD